MIEFEGCTLFFSHSREAPSLVGRVYDTGLASRLRSAQMKLWDMFHNFVTGYGGSGDMEIRPSHTFKSDTCVYFTIQKCACRTSLSCPCNQNFIILGASNGCRRDWCLPCLLVRLGRLICVCIRGFALFFGTGLLCIRDTPNGKSVLIDHCKGVVNDSPDYQGHDQRWSPPDSWPPV